MGFMNNDNSPTQIFIEPTETVEAEDAQISEIVQPDEVLDIPIATNTFTLSEVADYLKLKESKLRYWEQAFGEFLDNHRNQYNHRVFTKQDVAILEQIKDLYDSGLYTTEGVKQTLRGVKLGLENGGEQPVNNLPAVLDQKLGDLKIEINEQVRGEFVKALNNLTGELQLIRREMREDLLSGIKQEMEHMTQQLMPPKKKKKLLWW
jgi:DNA-binding transcriptional MerR regulator